MEQVQQYLLSYLGDTAYKIEPTDVKNIFWVELQDSTTIDEITKKISSIKDVEIIKGLTLKSPFEILGVDADESKRRGKTTIKVKSNISNLEGGGSMAEEGVELSPKERGRLDELQKKEDIDNLNELENKEYEILVNKYRKTKEYKHYKKSYGGSMATGSGHGKSAEEVWNAWTHSQRLHFLTDHETELEQEKALLGIRQEIIFRTFYNQPYQELHEIIKETLHYHIFADQYAGGGSIPNNYEKIAHDKLWEIWTTEQRLHFLKDHALDYPIVERHRIASLNDFYNVPYEIAKKVREHKNEGQYAGGRKSDIVPYVVYGKRLKQTPSGFESVWETIHHLDRKPSKGDAEKHRNEFNESLKKGGANEHLGTNYRVTDAKIINQKTGEEIDFYKAPTFETFSEGAALSDKFNVPIWQGGLYYLKLDNLIRDNYNKTMKIKGYFKDGIRVMENTDFPLANQQLIDIPFNVLADFIESGRFKIANVVYETERDKKLLQNEINTILDAYKVATTEAEKARLAREVATTEAEKAQIETDYSKQLLNMGDSINKLKQEYSDTIAGMEAMAGGGKAGGEKKYSISFIGRKTGAIGKTYRIRENIISDSQDNAINKLFDKYDLIGEIKIDGKKVSLIATGGGMERGGKLPDQYKRKSAADVWGAWTKDQRKHFLIDHKSDIDKFVNEKGYAPVYGAMAYEREEFVVLPNAIQDAIDLHLEMGRYAGGGEIYKPEKKGTIFRGNELIKYYQKVNGNYRLNFYRIDETKSKIPVHCDKFGDCLFADIMDVQPADLYAYIKEGKFLAKGGSMAGGGVGSYEEWKAVDAPHPLSYRAYKLKEGHFKITHVDESGEYQLGYTSSPIDFIKETAKPYKIKKLSSGGSKAEGGYISYLTPKVRAEVEEAIKQYPEIIEWMKKYADGSGNIRAKYIKFLHEKNKLEDDVNKGDESAIGRAKELGYELDTVSSPTFGTKTFFKNTKATVMYADIFQYLWSKKIGEMAQGGSMATGGRVHQYQRQIDILKKDKNLLHAIEDYMGGTPDDAILSSYGKKVFDDYKEFTQTFTDKELGDMRAVIESYGGSMADGVITAEQIWDGWTYNERHNFLKNHNLFPTFYTSDYEYIFNTANSKDTMPDYRVNQIRHAKEVVDTLDKHTSGGSMAKGGEKTERAIFKSYAPGGLPAKYIKTEKKSHNMSPEEVWESWSVDQRYHFLLDHESQLNELGLTNKDEIFNSKNNSYSGLSEEISSILNNHVKEGVRYAIGGSMATGEKAESHIIGDLVFAKEIGSKGLVGLVVSMEKEEDGEKGNDVYFRGLMGDTLFMPRNEMEDILSGGHLLFAENNGDLMHYPNIAKKLEIDLNPIYQEAIDNPNEMATGGEISYGGSMADGGKLEVANEIKRQLGHKALFMLGAKDMVGDEKSLSFKIRGSKKWKHIKITLNAKDLYDITFMNWRKLDFSDIEKKTINDIYFDQMHEIIEEETGLYTKLSSGGSSAGGGILSDSERFKSYASAKFSELKTALANKEITEDQFDKKTTALGHEIETKFHELLIKQGKTEEEAIRMAVKQRNDFFIEQYSFSKGGKTWEEYGEHLPKVKKLFNEHYEGRPRFKTLEEARNAGTKWGNWIIFVDAPEGDNFYTMTTFEQKWVKPRNVFGMWNELTLIEKTRDKKKTEGGYANKQQTTNQYIWEHGEILDSYPSDVGGSSASVEHIIEFEGKKYIVNTNQDEDKVLYANKPAILSENSDNSAAKGVKINGLSPIKKINKKDKFWHARIISPKGAKTCAVPEWAETIASTVHEGAKVTTCIMGDKEWHVQKVMVPVKGINKSKAKSIAEQIVAKIIKN